MTDNRFRERRSAYIDETEAAESPPAAPETAAMTEDPAPAPPAQKPAAEPAAEERRPGAEAAPLSPDEIDSLAAGGPADVYGPGGLPAPSFVEIVQVFALQALQFLGEVPLNEAGERHVFPDEAKHFIDLLGILEERTRGNLSPEEAKFLEQLLADLRLRYLRIQP